LNNGYLSTAPCLLSKGDVHVEEGIQRPLSSEFDDGVQPRACSGVERPRPVRVCSRYADQSTTASRRAVQRGGDRRQHSRCPQAVAEAGVHARRRYDGYGGAAERRHAPGGHARGPATVWRGACVAGRRGASSLLRDAAGVAATSTGAIVTAACTQLASRRGSMVELVDG
jgi:hypothetical protein